MPTLSTKGSRGKPTTTWLSVVKIKLNIEWDDAIEIAKNSKDWNIIINRR